MRKNHFEGVVPISKIGMERGCLEMPWAENATIVLIRLSYFRYLLYTFLGQFSYIRGMSQQFHQILAQIRQLAKNEQLILISTLTQEMAVGEEGEFSEEDQRELRRRIEDVASGRVPTENWESVRAEWRAKYGA